MGSAPQFEWAEPLSLGSAMVAGTVGEQLADALSDHTWPEDGQHILALGRGGPLRLSGQGER